jgi:hypothetical protein
MPAEMSNTQPKRSATSRRSVQQAGNNFEEVMRLADAEQSVVLTRDGKDHLIVLTADHARALVERLEQATAQAIASPQMHDRGGKPALPAEQMPEIANLKAAVENIKLLMHDRGG